MLRFALVFGAIVLALFTAELTPPGQRLVVEPWTALVAKAATSAMKAFDPGVVADGSTITQPSNGFAVTILAGCNGIEAMIILGAALLAYPAPVKHKLIGLAAGIAATGPGANNQALPTATGTAH